MHIKKKNTTAFENSVEHNNKYFKNYVSLDLINIF